MLEKKIERRFFEMVRKRGGLIYKFVSPNNPGVPDRIIVTPAGVVWFVELKTLDGEESKLQKYHKRELEKRNANVRVLYGLDAAKEFINEVLGHGI